MRAARKRDSYAAFVQALWRSEARPGAYFHPAALILLAYILPISPIPIIPTVISSIFAILRVKFGSQIGRRKWEIMEDLFPK